MAHILTGSDAHKPATVDWLIAIGGIKGEMTVKAASIGNERANQSGIELTVLRDEDGEIVFQSPAQSVAYIRRAP